MFPRLSKALCKADYLVSLNIKGGRASLLVEISRPAIGVISIGVIRVVVSWIILEPLLTVA